MKQEKRRLKEELRLKAVSLEKAIGEKSLHDMTCIIPHQCKGPAFKSGQEIRAGDISLLRKMGRKKIYVKS